ncbi:hypothetical protein HYE82_24125 [Streptomyces sp. BR123]|uniref:hypothetical protein n=1 Tax=Streptomyces sp. BR123 TaxID=2749828 RepID=UPI0015C430C5|nr:hypothetical protein [Streptomyces sp. BR123]NXY97405.1 hypothetical protein [Streptomyces sp. BR123]
MASTRSARAIAALAALPLAALLCSGTARADGGAGAGTSSNAAAAEIVDSGVFGANAGNSSTTQQVATGSGATNQSNAVQLNGTGSAPVGQSNGNAPVSAEPAP